MTRDFALPEEARGIIELLSENGFEAFAVGGCVRDILRGKKPSDLDIATNAKPDNVRRVFEGYRVIDTGIKHGTVTVLFRGTAAEITTYRADGAYTDGRRPDSVKYTRTIDEDLSRRDFTINAMAYNQSRGLVDLYGGREDINNKIIRCVGSPELRFQEDALRILRAVRFASVLGFNIEPETAVAVHACVPLLKNISMERIFSEIKKLLDGEYAHVILEQYDDIIRAVLPEMEAVSENEYKASVKMISFIGGDAYLKLAALMYFSGADGARKMLRRLKSDNASAARVCGALSADLSNISSEGGNICRLLYRFGLQSVLDAAALGAAFCTVSGDGRGAEKFYGFSYDVKRAAESQVYSISQLAVNGRDIYSVLNVSGTQIGKILELLLFAVMDGKVLNDRELLLKYSKNLEGV